MPSNPDPRGIVIVAAVARNGVIGDAGTMPWHLPDDLRRFKRLTLGGTLVMGRRTYDSIGRPLPGRRTVVVTRNPDWRVEGVDTAASLEAALDLAAGIGAPTFVVGGGEIYRLAMPLASRLEITEIEDTPAGDTTFPPIDEASWAEVTREGHVGFSHVTYERRADALRSGHAGGS